MHGVETYIDISSCHGKYNAAELNPAAYHGLARQQLPKFNTLGSGLQVQCFRCTQRSEQLCMHVLLIMGAWVDA